MAAQVHCARCGRWSLVDDVRLLGAPKGMFLWSPLCRACEDPRLPTRFQRAGVGDTMPSDTCVVPDLYEACREVLRVHQELRTAYWGRDQTALKRLVTAVMSASKGTLDPRDVEHELTLRLEAWPQIRSLEDELWGVWDWGTEDWISTHNTPFEAEMGWEQALNERGFVPVSPLASRAASN